jgi:glycosyltransferase involved in cell wall biosynthesis
MKSADIISIHPGKQHNLEQAEQLTQYFDSVKHITSIAFSKSTVKKWRFLPTKILNEMGKRSINSKASYHVDTYPWLELLYKWKRISRQDISNGFFKNRNRLFQKYILKKYAPPKIFIGFDTSSEYIFEEWKGKSILILDLTIAAPQYKKKLAIDYELSEDKLEKLLNGDEIWYDTYRKELELSDFVLCGSDFVRQSCLYLGVNEKRLKIIPYGANLEQFIPLIMPSNRPKKPFKIVFVGNVSYRKGADVLLRAWENLIKEYDFIELHFYGNLQIELKGFYLKNVFFHGFILQDDLIKKLSESHVSILPTFFEGSSYAIYQSMALGLAVVTTPNCGSIVKNMQDGILIDYGSEIEIYNALSLLINNPDICLGLAETAMCNIQEYTWKNYGKKLQNFICDIDKS